MKDIKDIICVIQAYANNNETHRYDKNEFRENIPKHIYQSIDQQQIGSINEVYPNNELWKPLEEFSAWKAEQGWWTGDYLFPANNGLVDYKYVSNPTRGLFDYRNYFGFIRIKLVGTTLKQRNLFIRPPVDLNLYADSSGEISIEKMKSVGYNTDDIFKINYTQVLMEEDIECYKKIYDEKKNLGQSIYVDRYHISGTKLTNTPINFMKWTEKLFEAEQHAIDNKGNLSGKYLGQFDTFTYMLDDKTILYQVPLFGNIVQNQLTTLNKDNSRVRTAQGFSFGSWESDYSSYYRETRLDASSNNTLPQVFINAINEKRKQYTKTNNILHPTYQNLSNFPPTDKYTLEEFFSNDSWWDIPEN